jgi:hypothetical protein
MGDQNNRQFELSTEQINEIKNRVEFDKSTGKFNGENSWKAYEYVYSLIKDSDKVNSDTKLWFQRAAEINKNDLQSTANFYIRSVTKFGLE